MKEKESTHFYIHVFMCFIGGFLGAYGLLNRMENFGSAQTGNLMQLVFCILGKDKEDLFFRLGGFLIYIGAIFFTICLQQKTKLNLKQYAIWVNIVGSVVLIFLPVHMNPILALYPLFFMTATQWSIFHGAKGYNCSTIFSTNNVKQTILAFGTYFFVKEEKELEKGKFFLISILCFHFGVAISYLTYLRWGIFASPCCIIPLLICLFITYKEKIDESSLKQDKNH